MDRLEHIATRTILTSFIPLSRRLHEPAHYPYMLKLSNLARLFYALAITLIGIQFIIYEDFGSHLAPLSIGTPGFNFWMHALGLILVICGLGLGLEFKSKLASVILAILFLLILLVLHLPRLFSATIVGEKGADAIEVFALLGGAILLAANYSMTNSDIKTPAQGQRTSARGFLFVGLSLVAFGIRHFIYADEMATQIPDWIPFHIFFTYGIGILFLTFSVSILFKVGLGWFPDGRPVSSYYSDLSLP